MAAAALATGDTIAGRYRVVAHLGSGGMGDVYEVEHVLLGKRFALKRLAVESSEDEAMVARFLREARAAAATGHPGVVEVVDVGFAEDGKPYLVMERLSGETLRDRIERGPLDEPTLRRVAYAVLDALDAVHRAGIIHRDIKPENLFLCRDGRLVILDFGLSHDTAVDVRLTQSGAVMGTPMYMAPEQARGEPLDAGVDLYAVGAVLYEAACGRPPFAAPAYSVLVAMILETDPDAASLAHLPAPVRDVIVAALAKRRGDRPASAAAMREAFGLPPDVEGWGEIPAPAQVRALVSVPTIASGPDAIATKVGKRKVIAPPRRRWVFGAAAVGVAVAAGAAAFVIARGDGAGGAAPVVFDVAASRRVTFDAGCEEYPRFTPDGRTIVYDGVVDGDSELLAIAVDGGAPRRLTHTPGWDYAPAIAPDGTRIAYVHEDGAGRSVRVVGIDGDRASATQDLGRISGYPAWTADGALLVGDAGGRILRRELGGSGELVREAVLGTLPPGARPYHLAAIRGGGVAVQWWTSSDADASALGELDAGGALRVVEEGATEYEGGLAASPTTRGYYSTRRGAATGNQLLWRRWGGGAPEVVPGGLSPRAGLDVAADGRRLAFSTCAETPYVARVTAGAAPVVLTRGEWQDSAPAPVDATRLLVTSDRGGRQQGWIVDLAGGAPRAVTPPDAHGASPSRDGRLVVYAADGGRGGLAIVPVEGGPPRAITSDPSDTSPVFTRDGRAVVFARAAAAGAPRIHVVPVDGGAARELAAGVEPAASPVDDTVAFVVETSVTGARQVMLIDAGGGAPRPLPGLEAAAWRRPRFSPDGQRLLLVRGYREIVTVPLAGGAPEVVWTAGAESVLSADWAADGDGVVAAIGEYAGDLWIAEGTFP